MKIAVVGCGNMARALILSMAEADSALEFLTYTPSEIKAKLLAEDIGGTFCKNLSDLKNCDIWFIACKPQQVRELAAKISIYTANKKIISILASTKIKVLKDLFKTNHILRVMPNTPSVLGMGISLLSFSEELIDKKRLESLFKSCGDTYIVSEKELDELTAFTGSGPALIFFFAKMLQDQVIALGYSEIMARQLLNKLFEGSSALMANSPDTLSELVDKVTSEGGVTIEGIRELEKQNFSSTLFDSIRSIQNRGVELEKKLYSSN